MTMNAPPICRVALSLGNVKSHIRDTRRRVPLLITSNPSIVWHGLLAVLIIKNIDTKYEKYHFIKTGIS